MLSFHSAAKGEIEVATDSKIIPPEVNWIDVLQPNAREIAFLERALGIEMPTLESLSVIESSRRLRTEKDWLYISIPMIYTAGRFHASANTARLCVVEGPASDGSFQDL